MKKVTRILSNQFTYGLLSIVLCTAIFCLYSCQDKDMDGMNEDFKASLNQTEVNAYQGDAVPLELTVHYMDNGNTSPIIATPHFESGKLFFNNQQIQSNTPIDFDFKTGSLHVSYIPESDDQRVSFDLKDGLISRQVKCHITAQSSLYDVQTDKLPDHPFVGDKFAFGLNVKPKDETNTERTLMACAQVIKGTGTIFNGDKPFIDKDTTSQVIIGTNTLSFLPSQYGNTILRFTMENKWGMLFYKDVNFNVYLPEWSLDDSSKKLPNDTLVVVPNQKYSFTLNLNQKDAFDGNVYTGLWRALGTAQVDMNLNNKDLKVGEQFPLTGGSTIGEFTSKKIQAGQIEFIAKDKFNQEHHDTIWFRCSLFPIELNLNTTQISPSDTTKAQISLHVQEKCYNESYKLHYTTLSGISGKVYINDKLLGTGGFYSFNYSDKDLEISILGGTTAKYQFSVTDNYNQQSDVILNDNVKNNITVKASEGGTVQGGGSYDYHTQVGVSATPNQGYSFEGWYIGSLKVSDQTAYQFICTKSETLTARFATNKYHVNVTANTGGTASGSGAYDYGQDVILTADPAKGYSFVGWYNQDDQQVSTSLVFKIQMGTKDLVFTAKFKPNSYQVELQTTQGGTISGSGQYDYNSDVTVQGNVQTGYFFMGWFNGNNLISNKATYGFKMPAQTVSFTAKFGINKFSVVVKADQGGTATGEGSFDYGTSTTVTASANTGYNFSGWYEGNTLVSSNTQYTFSVTSARSLVAHFNICQYTVSITNAEGISTKGSGNYQYGAKVTLIATPASGYRFNGWYESNNLVCNKEAYTFTVTGNMNLITKSLIEVHIEFIYTTIHSYKWGQGGGRGTGVIHWYDINGQLHAYVIHNGQKQDYLLQSDIFSYGLQMKHVDDTRDPIRNVSNRSQTNTYTFNTSAVSSSVYITSEVSISIGNKKVISNPSDNVVFILDE